MSFFFSQKKPKSLSEVVYALNEWILRISEATPSPVAPPAVSSDGAMLGESDQQKQAVDEVGRLLAQLRRATWGASVDEAGADTGADPEQITALAKEVYATGVLLPLVQHLRSLDFDARRDVASFFGYMLQRRPTVDYLLQQMPQVFEVLLVSAGDPETHRTVGYMLRECAKQVELVQHTLGLQSFWMMFQYMDDPDFEIATDNFSTFQDFVMLSPEVTTVLLDRHGTYFTQCINGLIRSPNYVARRQSLRLLYSVLWSTKKLTRFLDQYVSDVENLKVVMYALRDKSKNIYYEAFQLFKLYTANPRKPAVIRSVLVRNHDKLIEVLNKDYHHGDRELDKTFQHERDYTKRHLDLLYSSVNGSLARPAPSQSQAQAPSRSRAPAEGAGAGKSPLLAPKSKSASPPALPPNQNAGAAPLRSQTASPTPDAPVTPPLRSSEDGAMQVPPLPPMTPFSASTSALGQQQPPSPSRAQVPAAFLSPRPASPVLSQQHHFPSMPGRDAGR